MISLKCPHYKFIAVHTCCWCVWLNIVFYLFFDGFVYYILWLSGAHVGCTLLPKLVLVRKSRGESPAFFPEALTSKLNLFCFWNRIFINLHGLKLHFKRSGTPFWKNFEGLRAPWHPLGDPKPPKSDLDRFFLDFGVPQGPYFEVIFQVLNPLGALLEALGALLRPLGALLEAVEPLLELFLANVVILRWFLWHFGLPQKARTLENL